MLATDWICGACREPLAEVNGSYVCVNRHAYDLAREGYVNFLAGRQKAGSRGDTPEMLAARRRFLGAGYYEPMRRRVGEMVRGVRHEVVLEAGCGEGYYIGGLSEQLIGSKCLATDIAKAGVKMGAKRYPAVAFAVADTNQFLPVGDGAVDVLVDVFAPRSVAEFGRVVAPGGHLVVVIPTSRHLAELRQELPMVGIQEDKRQVVEASLREYFAMVVAEVVRVPLVLGAVAVRDLVAMTPTARFAETMVEQLEGLVGERRVTAEFEILVLRRR